MSHITTLGKALGMYGEEKVFDPAAIESLRDPAFASKYLQVFRGKRLDALSKIKESRTSQVLE
jgi:hypothetical protein